MTQKSKEIPKHLGIIIDGNRRWAKEKGLPAFKGHLEGLNKLQDAILWCKDRGVKILTLFVFSTENWKRSKSEVDYLMRLGEKVFKEYKKSLAKKGIRIRIIGQKERLPDFLQKEIESIEELTKDNEMMTVNFALSYGGKAEIVSAIKKIIELKTKPEDITEDLVTQNLWTSNLDLLIRTGKEQRISNFLIWQAAYSEIYFFPKYWPDFTEDDLDEILLDYNQRQRRFGK